VSRENHSIPQDHLDLETPGPSASTSALELASLAGNIWLLVRVGSESKMLDRLTGVLGATKEKGVGSSGRPQGKLIDGESLAAGLDDAGTRSRSEAESSDGELGEFQETVVVSNGADLRRC